MLNKTFKLFKSKRARARLWPWAKKTAVLTLIALALLIFAPETGYQAPLAANETVAPDSAIQTEITAEEADERALKLAAYLESKGSILAPYAVDFVQAADNYRLDWRLLPAIAGVESGYAKRYVRSTYNAWGWGGGYIYLESWPSAIEVISKSLRVKYADKWGAVTVDQIGPIWAEDPNWSKKVNFYIRQIEDFMI